MTKLKIEGMSCSHCEMSVKTALEGVEGVRKVQVDLAAGQAVVEGDTKLELLVSAVEAEGYSATAASG